MFVFLFYRLYLLGIFVNSRTNKKKIYHRILTQGSKNCFLRTEFTHRNKTFVFIKKNCCYKNIFLSQRDYTNRTASYAVFNFTLSLPGKIHYSVLQGEILTLLCNFSFTFLHPPCSFHFTYSPHKICDSTLPLFPLFTLLCVLQYIP